MKRGKWPEAPIMGPSFRRERGGSINREARATSATMFSTSSSFFAMLKEVEFLLSLF